MLDFVEICNAVSVDGPGCGFFDKTRAVGVADPDGMRAHASGSGAERAQQQEQAAAENEQIFVLLEN